MGPNGQDFLFLPKHSEREEEPHTWQLSRTQGKGILILKSKRNFFFFLHTYHIHVREQKMWTLQLKPTVEHWVGR